MALHTKVGGRESDSFITVTEADAYIADLPDGDTEWGALTTANKEYRLKLAANVIGFMRLRGVKAYRGQSLPFPRNYQSNVKIIPEEVKIAQAFIAVSVVHRGLATRPSDPTKKETINDINQLYLGGALMVSFSRGRSAPKDTLTKIIQSAQFPATIGMKKHTTQIRGIIPGPSITLSTTTTTTSSTTTTT